MPLHPSVYASLLAKIQENKISVWLINTGWTGARPYGVGHRIHCNTPE